MTDDMNTHISRCGPLALSLRDGLSDSDMNNMCAATVTSGFSTEAPE